MSSLASVGSSSRSVSVTLDEAFVVVVLEKTRSRHLFSSDKLSVVLHTSCARCVRVLIVVALSDVGVYDDPSSNLSVCVGCL